MGRFAWHAALAATIVGLAATASAGTAQEDARQILETGGVKGGLIVHVGCGDGRLTADLATGPFIVHGLGTDAAVAAARRHIEAKGLTGKASVARWDGGRLPYVDSLVNLIVARGKGQVSGEEMARILAPRGRALVRSGSLDTGHLTLDTRSPAGLDGWSLLTKPVPREIDEWTHYLRDASGNAVARDAQVGPPRHMQWLADPLWSRNHHTLASISSVVSTAGRLFYILDDGPPASMNVPGRWSLVGRDAFNGALLWKRAIDEWAYVRRGFRSGPVQLPRLLVAEGERVYAPTGISGPVAVFDAVTGTTLRTCKGTDGTEEIVLHQGVLLVVTGGPMSEQAAIDPARAKEARFPNQKAIVALRAETGGGRWRWPEPEGQPLMPLTLAAEGKRVFLQAGKGIVCLALDSGKELWRTQQPTANVPTPEGKRRAGKTPKKKRQKGLGKRGAGWSVATLVVHDGVVLWADGGKLQALSADQGKALWDCPSRAGFRSPADVFVASGLVWLGPDFAQGRDPRTGEVKKSMDTMRALRTAGHHHRCYRQKATDRYIMEGYRGIEFMDLVGDNHSRNNWIRGVCQYGILPCNGLIYAPPNACGCFMEGLLHGFWAVAASSPSRAVGSDSTALEKGPAFGKAEAVDKPFPDASPWPTLRGNPLRSGSTATDVPTKLGEGWRAKVGGRLTPPVVAGGLVAVASIDAHRVVALDAATGKQRWSFTAGGRVDSPPTLHQSLALFGCADGWVYCLRRHDGALVWRFRAAPEDRRTVVRDQVESVWPVHGSVLVEGGVAYVAAGRHSYLDGGLRLYGLDPATGKVLSKGLVRDRHPKALEGTTGEPRKGFAQNATDSKTFKAPDRSDAFSMSAARSDVLVSDGTSIYLRHVRLDRQCAVQKTMGRHLLSTSRLLDDAENHRSHWVLGTGDFSRTPVAYSWIANRQGGAYGSRLSVPYGLMLAFDDKAVWGVRRGGRGGGYTLYAQGNKPFSPGDEPLPDFRKSASPKPPAWQWSMPVAFRPRAILRAGKTLVVGGMPDLNRADDPYAALAGRAGGILWLVSAADGKTQATYKLDAPPVWDGLAAADGQLYVSTLDGSVRCLSADGATPLKQAALAAPTPTKPTARPANAPSSPPGGKGRPGAAVRPDKAGKLVLTPEAARTTGRLRYQADRNNLGSWSNPDDYCEWNLDGVKAGTYAVEFSYGTSRGGVSYAIVAGGSPPPGGEPRPVAGGQRLAGKTENTGGIKTYKAYPVGRIALPDGKVTLAVKPGKFTGGAIMNFRLLTLTPVK